MTKKEETEKKEEPVRRRFSLFPKPLSKSVDQVVKPVYKKHGFAESRILTEWAAIVGAELADCSVPQKITFSRGKREGGTLYILVSGARALELQHMQPLILDKIATYFGYPAISRLTFMQTSTTLFRRETKAGIRPRPPADATVSALVRECEDDALRAALESLGNTLAAARN
jgi:hypothetical protein